MKSYVITDNISTLVGMQLAGVEGELISKATSFNTIFDKVTKDEEIGILMIAPKLIEQNQKKVDEFRFNQAVPLIVEIPGSDEYASNRNKIAETIQKAVNISV
ncbi:V/A-type H+-transporting ATPase subunit F [Atopostipes suicloacalis DSM 15692]|uniref:V/A-type H+-transporting ATPase subunit F n=1 Tax=Atopostipes suicloacalis DSM 15692 TaxID=1121025 RepID=A0A1M4TV34_9LACT|nr:V-type ATP synthase subunit F [Atopostipes suicloacalis]SHE48339.1 V/A-type H+-transporting ATPase subunit F [Atopostipes suicloacalis DSM 15692]